MTVWEEGLSDGDEIFGKGIKEDELDEVPTRAENRRWVGQWRWVEDDRTSKPIEDRRKDLTTESIKGDGEICREVIALAPASDGDEIFGKGIKEDELDELSDRVPTHSKDNTVRHDKKDTQQYRTGHETGHEETGKTHMTGQGM
ncbi:hypothetical protein PPACK8108_LOCUS2945 [Phakopsora pachyrhizi]|uniref:Uncharacterized protein n=1 Tax=Phakopsora pachyrhizi TaxID=170000 RepID=A0AAV0AIZ9_PHAPC|nr:hypothetical protein PPACK8108_LOCUS2945 [Phakopsora pachyrhizi]